MRGIIAALSADRVIGKDGTLPWHYPADLKRFRRLTLGAAVLMGRLTWESLPKRPLEGRRNLVITGRRLEGVECFPSVGAALAAVGGADLWFIGGARIFAEAMAHADVIDLTVVPDRPTGPGLVYFPEIDEGSWLAEPRQTLEGDERLWRQRYLRRA